MHRLLVKIAQVEKLHPEGQTLVSPERLVRAELDLPVLIVSQLAQKLGQIRPRRVKGLAGARLGPLGHVIKGHMHRLQPWKGEGGGGGPEHQRKNEQWFHPVKANY